MSFPQDTIARWMRLDVDVTERIYRLIDEGELYRDIPAALAFGHTFVEIAGWLRTATEGRWHVDEGWLSQAWSRFHDDGWRPTDWTGDAA